MKACRVDSRIPILRVESFTILSSPRLPRRLRVSTLKPVMALASGKEATRSMAIGYSDVGFGGI